MVKQSNGYIWVYSEPGQGTCFKIFFPRAYAAVEAAGPATKADLRGTETLLIVEDQAEVRNLAVSALQQFGYRILSAGNPAEALDLARGLADPIHLLITDVVMPGMAGPELAGQLLDGRPDMRVLYISGYTDDVIANRGVPGTTVTLVQKPFTTRMLAGKVREVLDRA
jgi:CheY-like chemotaxis protein